jgi:hypothetical protein
MYYPGNSPFLNIVFPLHILLDSFRAVVRLLFSIGFQHLSQFMFYLTFLEFLPDMSECLKGTVHRDFNSVL